MWVLLLLYIIPGKTGTRWITACGAGWTGSVNVFANSALFVRVRTTQCARRAQDGGFFFYFLIFFSRRRVSGFDDRKATPFRSVDSTRNTLGRYMDERPGAIVCISNRRPTCRLQRKRGIEFHLRARKVTSRIRREERVMGESSPLFVGDVRLNITRTGNAHLKFHQYY